MHDDTITQTITQLPDPSGFSSDPFTDVLRDGARKLIEQAIHAELSALMNACSGETLEDDVGGFLGIGERQIAVSMPQVRFVSDSSTTDDASDFFLVVQAPRAMVEGAPAYPMNEFPMDARKATDTGMDTAEAMPMTTDAGNATDMDATKAPMMAVEGYNSVDLATLTAENLIGATVFGGEDNSVGTVSDVRIGAGDKGDKIDGLIVDVGGFLGIGSKPVAVPLNEAQVLKDANGTEVRVYVPMSKDDLTAQPEVKSN